jgi:hypothetical protein
MASPKSPKPRKLNLTPLPKNRVQRWQLQGAKLGWFSKLLLPADLRARVYPYLLSGRAGGDGQKINFMAVLYLLGGIGVFGGWFASLSTLGGTPQEGTSVFAAPRLTAAAIATYHQFTPMPTLDYLDVEQLGRYRRLSTITPAPTYTPRPRAFVSASSTPTLLPTPVVSPTPTRLTYFVTFTPSVTATMPPSATPLYFLTLTALHQALPTTGPRRAKAGACV